MQCSFLVDASVRSVAENPLIDGDAGDVIGTHTFNERFVQRLVMPFVVFTDKDPHKLGLSFAPKRRSRRLWSSFLGHFGRLDDSRILDINQSSTHHLVQLW